MNSISMGMTSNEGQMLMKMLKTYTITVVVQEGNDEFWESLEAKTGCDEVVDQIRESLEDHGWRPQVTLTSFNHEPPLPSDMDIKRMKQIDE
jgi:hypothetical protein